MHLLTPATFFSPFLSRERTVTIKPESFDMTRLSVGVQGTTRHIYPTGDTGNTWAEEMSSDKISACWDVLCFVDKAIIHHYALDSKNPLLRLRHIVFTHSLLTALLAFITNYCKVLKKDLITYLDCGETCEHLQCWLSFYFKNWGCWAEELKYGPLRNMLKLNM